MIAEHFKRVIYLDTETTGLDPEKDQIIELAFVACEGGKTVTEYDNFVRLYKVPEVPERITQITGITDLNCAAGVEYGQAMTALAAAIGPDPEHAVIIAHNAQFDINFLAETAADIGKARKKMTGKTENAVNAIRATKITAVQYLDSMTVYRDRAGYPYKLATAITHYGLDDKVQNTHRAIDDAQALKAVCDAMEAERDDLDRYVNIFGYFEKYGIEFKTLRKVTYRAQGYGIGITPPDRILPELIKAEQR